MITNFHIFENTDSDIKYWMKYVWDELKGVIKYKDKKNSIFPQKIEMKIYLEEESTDKESKVILYKKLEELKEKLIEENILISYDILWDVCVIYFKKLRTKEIIPLPYVYHCSPVKNRESIKKNGLIPKGLEDSTYWSAISRLSYPPMIFATNASKGENGKIDVWRDDDNWDIWRIDTEKLPNKWWVDLNFFGSETNYIMTFEPIPPKFLTLARKGKKK